MDMFEKTEIHVIVLLSVRKQAVPDTLL